MIQDKNKTNFNYFQDNLHMNEMQNQSYLFRR
jgi:hypothetical protein